MGRTRANQLAKRLNKEFGLTAEFSIGSDFEQLLNELADWKIGASRIAVVGSVIANDRWRLILHILSQEADLNVIFVEDIRPNLAVVYKSNLRSKLPLLQFSREAIREISFDEAYAARKSLFNSWPKASMLIALHHANACPY